MPQIRYVMVSEVVTVEPSASVVDAAQKMIQQEKGPLPVVEGDRLHAMSPTETSSRGWWPRAAIQTR